MIRVAPAADGQVPLARVLEALSPDTAVCSLMWANNETGVLQPVAEIVRRAHARGIRVLCDAVQAAGKVPVDAAALDADYLVISVISLFNHDIKLGIKNNEIFNTARYGC